MARLVGIIHGDYRCRGIDNMQVLSMNVFVISVLFVLAFGTALFFAALKRKMISALNTHDLIVIALMSSLLYAAGLPFKFGLGRLPFIHAFIYSVPFTAVPLSGIRVVRTRGCYTHHCGPPPPLPAFVPGDQSLGGPTRFFRGLSGVVLFITRSYCYRLKPGMRGVLRARHVPEFLLVSRPYLDMHYAPRGLFLSTRRGSPGPARRADRLCLNNDPAPTVRRDISFDPFRQIFTAAQVQKAMGVLSPVRMLPALVEHATMYADRGRLL